MKQFKKLILSMFVVLSTGLFANTVNMAPIISYLLSDTKSSSPQNFTMTLDVNESTVTGNWAALSSTSDIDATATVSIQGEYGTFVVTGDSLSYLKTIETNATDTGVLEIIEGTGTTEITVSVDSLYWKQITGGAYHTAAIKSDGTLWAWGGNEDGQLGDGSTNDSAVPVQEDSHSTDWISVGAGWSHTSAIKSDGTLWSWGNNGDGQLGDNSTVTKVVPVQEDSKSTDWSSVGAGAYHTAAIKSDGTLWAWGKNTHGELGDNSIVTKVVPVQEDSKSTDWSSIGGGYYHTAAIKSDGTLWSWGDNGDGQLGDNSTNDSVVPVQENSQSTDWSSIDVGYFHTSAIKNDGTLWAWGKNGDGQLGDNSTVTKSVPVQEDSKSTDWSSIRAGWSHTSAIKSDGTLWSWGKNEDGQLGDNSTVTKVVPVQEDSKSTDWASVTAGFIHALAIKSDGTLWSWGGNNDGQLGDGTVINDLIPGPIIVRDSFWINVVAGSNHTAAIKSDGTLWSWGNNGDGQLGDNSTNDSDVPVQEDSRSTDWSSIGAGYSHTSAIKSDGTLWSWGKNTYGQLGDNSTVTKVVPVQENSQSTDWSSVTAGVYHTAAIKSDGTLWAWGGNEDGQLGDGSTNDSAVPVNVLNSPTPWSSVTAGWSHTSAIRSDGTLWSWGSNSSGVLGDNSGNDSTVPVQEYSQSTDWSSIGAGYYHTAAIKSDGTLWTWGHNTFGQLGDNSTNAKVVPVQEYSQSTDWSSVTAGIYHTAAIKSDGTLWAWGSNSSGQLGDNSINNSAVPVQEYSNSTDWSSVTAGYAHTSTIKSDGTLWSWGRNDFKQLGTVRVIPMQSIIRK